VRILYLKGVKDELRSTVRYLTEREYGGVLSLNDIDDKTASKIRKFFYRIIQKAEIHTI